MAKMNSLHDVYIHTLKDLYSAERQLVQALPKMARAAQNPELKQSYERHLEETRQQAERLEQILTQAGQSAGGVKCKGMEGLIEEGSELLEEDPSPVLDAALIAASQKIEHYEISGYGTAATWAEMLGENQALRLLKQSISEEENTDELLTQLAESSINQQAMAGA